MLYQVTLRQTNAGQSQITTWHYNSAGTPAAVTGSFALTSALGFVASTGVYPAGRLFSALFGIQSTTIAYLEAEVAALYDPVDFYTLPFPPGTAGNRAGTFTSPVLAYGMNTNRVNRDIRRGQKRIGGVTEEEMTAGGGLTTAIAEDLQDLAEIMSDVLTYTDEGNTLSFTPVVLSFEPYETERGNTAYRPYATLAEQITHMASGVQWSVKPQVRTQNSRQYGHGS